MKPFTVLSGVAAPIDQPNVDTDQILPARFLKKPRGDPDFPRYLFHDLRFDDQGKEDPDFLLHRKPYRTTRILVADRNFACGSSREAAVYALMANGIRCVIAPSFGDIFFSNSFKNGNLPVIVDQAVSDDLRRQLNESPGAEMTVDLPAQTITAPDGRKIPFEIDAARKQKLLEGLDDITLTLKYADDIAAFEARRAADKAWTIPAKTDS
ncbi:MAG: 3-isopropylmalate dehydratase small subunit [Rhodospirillales bacterium]